MVEVNRISFTAVSLRFSIIERTFVAKDVFSYLIRLCWLLLGFFFVFLIYLYLHQSVLIKKRKNVGKDKVLAWIYTYFF